MSLDFKTLLGTLESPSRKSRRNALECMDRMQAVYESKINDAREYMEKNDDDLSKNEKRELTEYLEDAISQLEAQIRERIGELHDYLEDEDNDNSDIENELEYSFESDIESWTDEFYTDFEWEVDQRAQ